VSKKRVALLIRISPELKAKLTAIARREHRSVNQQIEHLLAKAADGTTETLSERRVEEVKRRD
jgi:hypothetical protein